jgi:AcrR family transcriptional regulator
VRDQITIDTNLQGQKLGQKGRVTRDRIIVATRELIEDPSLGDLSISSVARRANLRVSSIYNYFPDLSDLFMTVLEPTMDKAQEIYLSVLRDHWPDEELEACCKRFVEAFHRFWEENVRLLHVRNILAQQHDHRVLAHRINSARTTVRLLQAQMGVSANLTGCDAQDLASVLYAGMERVVTIVSDELLNAPYPRDIARRFGKHTLTQLARVMTLAIRDERSKVAGG